MRSHNTDIAPSHTRHRARTLTAFAVIAAVLVAAALLPALASAAPGDSESNAVPVSAGSSASAGLSRVASTPDYWAVFSVRLSVGQTLVATCTYSPSPSAPDLFGWAAFKTDVGSLHSRPVSATQRVITMLAPSTGTFFISALAQSAPGTASLDTTITSAVEHSLSQMAMPKSANHTKSFKVGVALSGLYDELTVPVRFSISRSTSNGWAPYSKVKPSAGSLENVQSVVFTKSLKLPKGTFRIRASLADAAHPTPVYNLWKTVRVK